MSDIRALKALAPVELGSVGRSGLKQWGGFIREEWLTDLVGPKGVRVYHQMKDNEPIVWVSLFLLSNLFRGVPWTMETESDNDAGQKAAAEFFEQVMDDMDVTWDDAIDEASSMLQYGWAVLEKVFKYRRGEHRDPNYRSKFTDGKIGLRNLKLLGQDTLQRWVYEDGELVAMEQQPDSGGPMTTVPLAKCVHFRTTKHKGNPEGRSVLRSCYRPYYFLHNIEVVEGIGIERDLVGYPVMYVPPELLMSDPPPELAGMRDALQKLVSEIRRDEREGALLPTDPSNPNAYKLELLKGGGERSIDTGAVIDRHRRNIAMAMLTDFVVMGHEKVGTQALSQSKLGYFAAACNGYLGSMEQTLNAQVVAPLLRMNGFNMPDLPKLRAGDVNFRDVSEKAAIVKDLAQAGLVPPEAIDVTNAILMELDLPLIEKAPTPPPASDVTVTP